MHKRIKKMETGASIGNIIDLDMMKQLGLRLGDYNTFMNTSTNKIKSDIGNFKSSGFDLTNKNPFSNAKVYFLRILLIVLIIDKIIHLVELRQ